MPSLVSRTLWRIIWLLVLSSPLAPDSPLYAADDSAELHRAYYLEHETRDYAAARTIYERLAADPGDAGLRSRAVRGAARCRDGLAAENFASLMPPDVLGYVELHRPLGLVSELARMVGLGTNDMSAALAARPDADGAAPFSLPSRIAISPALLGVLDSLGGAAVGITGIDRHGEPRGILVLHHGDAALLRGVLETAMQFAPTAKKIAGLPTFRVENKAVGVLTDALCIVGTSRALVADAVERLEGRAAESLASRTDLRELYARRGAATLFAFADAPHILKMVRENHSSESERREFAQINAIADLEHLRWAAFSLGANQGRLGLELTVRLDEQHHNLIYNLIRTSPMSRATLAYVPANAAAVFGLGMNPPRGAPADRAAAAAALPAVVTGWDIGREIFGNLQEVSVFVMPGGGVKVGAARGKHRETIPDVAIVLASNDAAHSQALWDGLLSLPAKLMGHDLPEPQEVTIGSATGRAYALPDIGKLYVVQQENCLLAGPSKAAIRAALDAARSGKSVASDAAMKPVLAQLPDATTAMLIAHGGRSAAMAGQRQDGLSQRAPFNIAAEALDRTVLSAAIGESATEFSIRIGVTGLPDVNGLVQKLAPMFGGSMARSSREDRHEETQ